ncbi:MAG: hypothetical protein WKG06_05850 [Segetibacter sp.]
MLNVNPAVQQATVIVPVPTAHVGSVTITEGVAGAAGGAFTVTVTPADIQPAAFLALMI